MGLGTAEVYRELGKHHSGEGAMPLPEALLSALKSGDVESLAGLLHNRLQEPAMSLCPPVKELYGRMKAAGAAGCLMSGSGSCLFALCRNQREAEQVIDDLRSGWPPGDELASTRMFPVKSCVNVRDVNHVAG
jgi:4-diphosphocytidyl-2-C-methyl-D-erythritol kinase